MTKALAPIAVTLLIFAFASAPARSAQPPGPPIPTPKSTCQAKCSAIYNDCRKANPTNKPYCDYNNNQCLATCRG